MNRITYKVFLEAIALIALLAGASFCAELFLPGVISLSQKTLVLLSLVVIAMVVARHMSLSYPTEVKQKDSTQKTTIGIGLLSLIPLYFATKNFSPAPQATIIILSLSIGYLLLREDKDTKEIRG